MFKPPKAVRLKWLDRRYAVGDDGNIYSDGCALVALAGVSVNIHGERKKVAYLVARAWVPNQEGRPYVVHRNGDVRDNRPDNLEWSEKEEKRRRGPKPSQRVCSAYTKEGIKVGMYNSPSEGAIELRVDPRLVRRCLAGHQRTAGGYIWRWGV